MAGALSTRSGSDPCAELGDRLVGQSVFLVEFRLLESDRTRDGGDQASGLRIAGNHHRFAPHFAEKVGAPVETQSGSLFLASVAFHAPAGEDRGDGFPGRAGVRCGAGVGGRGDREEQPDGDDREAIAGRWWVGCRAVGGIGGMHGKHGE